MRWSPSSRRLSLRPSPPFARCAARRPRFWRPARAERPVHHERHASNASLVSIEVALCLALLMAGAVLIQGLRDLSRRSPGYDAAGVLTAQIRLPDPAYRTPELRALVVQRLLDDIRAMPGVVSASTTQNVFVPGFSYQTLINVKDRPTDDGQPQTVQFRRVSSDYFKTLRIKTLSGRVFTDDDTVDRPAVAVVSRRFAEALLPGLDPIGRILLRANPPELTIVGVVDDVSDVSVTEPAEATLYLPWAQNNNSGMPVAFVIRTAVDPASLVPAVRDSVRRVDASLPLRRVQAARRLRDGIDRAGAVPDDGPRHHRGARPRARGRRHLGRDVSRRRRSDQGVRGPSRAGVGTGRGDPPRAVRVDARSGDRRRSSAWPVARRCARCWRARSGMSARSMRLTTGISIAVIGVVGIAAAFVPALRIMRVHPAEVLRS